MTFQQPWWLLLLGLLVLVFALHANRRRHVVVTSLFLWQQVQGHDDSKRATRRFPPINLLLILQALAVITIALALARPQFTDSAPDHWIIMLDSSTAMQEHGSQTQIRRILDRNTSSLITVVEVAGAPQVRATRLQDRRALRDFEPAPAHENSDWLGALRLISGTVLNSESTLVTVIGPPDVIREVSVLMPAVMPGAAAEYQPVGPDLPNNQFVSVEIQHQEEGWSVRGTVGTDSNVRVEFRPHAAASSLEWAELTTTNRRFAATFAFPGSGILELHLPADTVAADNVFRAELLDSEPDVQVLKVGTENIVMRRALLAAGATAVEQVPEISADSPPADLLILDGTHAIAGSARAVLVINAPGAAATDSLFPVTAPGHYLTDGVDFRSLQLVSSSILEPGADDAVLLTSPAGPLALISHTAAGPRISLGFDPADTTWHNTPAFPVFMANLLDLAVPQRGSRTALTCNVGISCQVFSASSITDPAGQPVELTPMGSFRPILAGEYNVDGQPLFVNAVGAVRRIATDGPMPTEAIAAAPVPEPWRWLAIAAVALIAAEMLFAATRRPQGAGRTSLTSISTQLLALVLLLTALLQLPVPTPFRIQTRAAVLSSAATAAAAPDGLPLIVHGETDDAPSVPSGALADGIRLAAGLLPAGGTLVVEVDGPLTRGGLSAAAADLIEAGIILDVVADSGMPELEALVSSISAPDLLHAKEAFELTATIHSTLQQTAEVNLFRNGILTDNQRVELAAGLNQVSFGASDDAGTWLYEVELNSDVDTVGQNNRHGRFVYVQPSPRLTVVTRHTELGELFAHALSLQGIPANVSTPVRMPHNAEGFREHDAIILIDVPALEFHSSQLSALEEWVSVNGGGLLIMGGANTFGPGGYYQTPLEDLSPLSSLVDRETPEVALLFLLDRSGSMQQAVGETNRLEIAKEATLGAIRALGNDSRAGIIMFDALAEVLVPLTSTADLEPFETALATLSASGGTSIYPALQHALREMQDVDASTRHLIVMTDGLSQAGDFETVLKELRELQVTVSTVAIGRGADVRGLANIARLGAGATHATTDFRALPSILGQEALLLSGSSVEEQSIQPVWEPETSGPSFQFLVSAAALHGFVHTSAKDGADVHLTATTETDEQVPLLATWKYGLGNVAAFASHGVGPWAADWQDDATYPALWSQIVRWIMPDVVTPGLTVSATLKGDLLDVLVTAVTADGQPDTGLDLEAVLLSPAGEPADVRLLDATNPGEYRASLLALETGVNWLGIGSRLESDPGQQQAAELPVFVPYPASMNYSAADYRQLEQLARATDGQLRTSVDMRPAWSLQWASAPLPVLWLLSGLVMFLVALYWRYIRSARR